MTDPGYALALLEGLGRQVVDLLWLPSLEALLLGAVVWALLQLNRGCPPRIRHVLWLLVLAKLVFSVVLPWPGPFEIPWTPVGHATGPDPVGHDIPGTYIYAVTGLAWIAFAGLGLIRVVSAVIMLTRRKGRTVPVTDRRVRESFDRCRTELGLKRSVALRISDEFEGPALIAIGRPVVVIPSWCILELSAEELKQVLLHELAHYARRDHLSVVLVQFALIFFFFHPAVWYAARRIDIEAEKACDAAVVRVSRHPKRYAYTLLKVAGSKVRTHWQAVLELARSASLVAMRIRDLLGSAANPKHRALFSLLAVGLCTLIAVMPLFRSGLNAPAGLAGLTGLVDPTGPTNLANPVSLAVMPARDQTVSSSAGSEPGGIAPGSFRPARAAVESGGQHAPAGRVERGMESGVPDVREENYRTMVDGRPAPRRSMAVMMADPDVRPSSGASESAGQQVINRAALGPTVAVHKRDRSLSMASKLRQRRIEVQGVGQTGNALFEAGTVSLSAGFFLTPTHQFGGVFTIRRLDGTEAIDETHRSPGASASYGGNLLRARKLAGYGGTALRGGSPALRGAVLESRADEQADRITRLGAFYRFNLPVQGGSFTPFLGFGTGLEIRPQTRRMTVVDAGLGLRYFWERHVALVLQAAYRKELDVISRPPYPDMTLGFSAIF